MGDRKADASRSKLNSSHVEGQGTTTHETGSMQDSSRKMKKQPKM